MISRFAASDVFKKVTSTTTGCELVGSAPIFIASILYAKFFNNNNAALEKALSLCPIGMLAGFGYSSYNKLNKWTLGATAVATIYSVCEYYFQCGKIDTNDTQITEKQTSERNKLLSSILGNVATFFTKPSLTPIGYSLCSIYHYYSATTELSGMREKNKEAKELEIYRSLFRASVYSLCVAAISEIGQVAVQHYRS